MMLSAAARSALLKWVNTIYAGAEVKTIAELNDGVILSEILGEIDSSYHPRHSPSDQKLQAIVHGLFRYIRTECDGLEPLLENPSLKEISQHSHPEQMFELLTVFLMAAISGPDRETYVGAITQLEGPVQREMAMIIREKQKECEDGVAMSSNRTQDRSALASDDIELEFEVRYSSLIAQKKSLEQEKTRLLKELADMDTRLNRLQDHNDTLQNDLTHAQDALSGAAEDGDRAAFIKSLEAKIREQEELIANQEGQIEQDRSERLRLRRDGERLSQATDRVQQLEDDLKEVKHQNLELTKKANTVDRFKQKLETMRDFEEMNKNLEYEIEELRGQLRELEQLKRRNASLEETQTKYQTTIEKKEVEIFELSSQKRALEDDRADIQRRIAILEERRELDEAVISNFQDQDQAKFQSPTSPTGPGALSSLETELQQSESSGNRHEFEISRLKAQVQILQGNAGAAQANAKLRSELEDATRIRKDLEAQLQEYFEKHVIATAQISSILEKLPREGSVKAVDDIMLIGELKLLTPEYYSTEAFSNLRKQQQSTADELSTTTKKLQATQDELESTRRNLLSATTDLSMVSKEDMDALEDLKSTQANIYSSIDAELKALQSRYKTLEIDSEQQKAHLVEVILLKDRLAADKLEQKTILDKVEPSKPTIPANDLEKELKERAEKFEKSLVSAQEAVKVRDVAIQELSAQIMEIEAGNNDTRKAELEKENTNLKREHAMMTTAWYDLTSRLQSNNVVLQRRADAPRSWINKQRQAVNNNFRR